MWFYLHIYFYIPILSIFIGYICWAIVDYFMNYDTVPEFYVRNCIIADALIGNCFSRHRHTEPSVPFSCISILFYFILFYCQLLHNKSDTSWIKFCVRMCSVFPMNRSLLTYFLEEKLRQILSHSVYFIEMS